MRTPRSASARPQPAGPSARHGTPDTTGTTDTPAGQVGSAILALVLTVPSSAEPPQAESAARAARAHTITRHAARKASLISGSLSLPVGVLGWLTVLPELLGVWRVQAQMVADIAAVYGKSPALGHEQMVYCLFRHVSAQLFRDVVVRVGERVLIRETSLQFLQTLAQKVGVMLTKTLIRKGAARFVPLLGAVGVGAYAYFDTLQVAKTAQDLFARDIVIENALGNSNSTQI